MTSITSIVPLPPPTVPALNVGRIAAATSVALFAADAEALPLPASGQTAGAEAASAGGAPDGAAMRPDQVFMSRQMAWPAADGSSLASAWRAQVRTYGTAMAAREQQARAGQLPATLLLAAQNAPMMRQQALESGMPADAWRFTVHPRGSQEQQLHLITEEADKPPGRRRRPRAALRLELELADGERVTLQVEPLPEGLILELCAAGTRQLERLRAVKPALEAAIERSGLRVLRWHFRDSLPGGAVHARVPSDQAAGMFTLPVFRALAELALTLPLRADRQQQARGSLHDAGDRNPCPGPEWY
jgi:hypothetical protein